MLRCCLFWENDAIRLSINSAKNAREAKKQPPMRIANTPVMLLSVSRTFCFFLRFWSSKVCWSTTHRIFGLNQSIHWLMSPTSWRTIVLRKYIIFLINLLYLIMKQLLAYITLDWHVQNMDHVLLLPNQKGNLSLSLPVLQSDHICLLRCSRFSWQLSKEVGPVNQVYKICFNLLLIDSMSGLSYNWA